MQSHPRGRRSDPRHVGESTMPKEDLAERPECSRGMKEKKVVVKGEGLCQLPQYCLRWLMTRRLLNKGVNKIQ